MQNLFVVEIVRVVRGVKLMTKLEKIIELSKSKGYESLEVECLCELCENCSFTKVMKNNCCELSCCANKLLEKYQEPRKLNKREHGLCEYLESGWLARDEEDSLWWFKEKPTKYDNRVWGFNHLMYVENELFNFIKWEDDEPYSVEEMLKWEVEE